MSAADFLSLLLAFYVLIGAFLVKNGLTLRARRDCIDIDFDHYRAGPSYDAMLFHPFRWTFAQHYPDLAKRVKP